MEGEKGEIWPGEDFLIHSHFPSYQFCNKSDGCPAEQRLQQDEKEKNIAGQPWSLKGFHCRVKTFVNTEEK